MADALDGLIGELAAKMLRRTEERMAAAPPEAAERLMRATGRAAEGLEEWLRELQEHDLLPPLSEGGRRVVVAIALLAAKLLHSLSGELKLAGVPEDVALGEAADGIFSFHTKIVLAAAIDALVRAAEKEEAGGGAGSC